MLRILLLSISIYAVFSVDIPCGKLNFFGNNIQNKVSLSPVIIVGKLGMEIPSVNDLYKITIEIKSIVKGSLGDWKKTIIVAGLFTKKNISSDLCQFKLDSKESRIFFLEVVMAQTGEYGVLFNPEIASKENLEEINKTICNNCVEIPKLLIAEKTNEDGTMQVDCITESKPPPIVKWVNYDGKTDIQFISLRNGARLLTKATNTTVNMMFICTGTNVIGESTTNVIIKALENKSKGDANRCAINDNLLCNGHGKCYKDSTDGGKMFCRCDPGFGGSRCSNNPNKLTVDYLVRSTTADQSYCNKNGEAYVNVITKKEFCICNNGFYGPSCSMQTSVAGRSASNDKIEVTPRDKLDIQRMLNAATSKVALHYILIGATIVLVGCVIVIIVIVCIMKREMRKVTGKQKTDRSPVRYDQDLAFGTNNRSHGDSLKFMQNYHEDPILLPPCTLKGNGTPKARSPPVNYSVVSNDNDFQLSGNGLYEGVNIQPH